MKQRGKNIYVPGVLFWEIEDIKRLENIKRRSIAIRRLIEYSRVGREVTNILPVRMIPSVTYPKKYKAQLKKKGLW